MAAVGFVVARAEYVGLGWRQTLVAVVGSVVARDENAGLSRVCDTLGFVGCTFGLTSRSKIFRKNVY